VSPRSFPPSGTLKINSARSWTTFAIAEGRNERTDDKIDTGDTVVVDVTVDFPSIRIGKTLRSSALVRRYLDVVNLATRNCLLFRTPLLSTSPFSRPGQTKKKKMEGEGKEERTKREESSWNVLAWRRAPSYLYSRKIQSSISEHQKAGWQAFSRCLQRKKLFCRSALKPSWWWLFFLYMQSVRINSPMLSRHKRERNWIQFLLFDNLIVMNKYFYYYQWNRSR